MKEPIKETIHISLDSSIRMYEVALKQARDLALVKMGIDEHGHSNRLEGWERSSCSIVVELESMRAMGGMMGWEYVFIFKVWWEKNEEDDE